MYVYIIHYYYTVLYHRRIQFSRNNGIKTDKYLVHIFPACIKHARRDVSRERLLHFARRIIFTGNTQRYITLIYKSFTTHVSYMLYAVRN